MSHVYPRRFKKRNGVSGVIWQVDSPGDRPCYSNSSEPFVSLGYSFTYADEDELLDDDRLVETFDHLPAQQPSILNRINTLAREIIDGNERGIEAHCAIHEIYQLSLVEVENVNSAKDGA